MIYLIQKQYNETKIIRSEIAEDGSVSQLVILIDPANADYQTFKAKINADEAQLEDADSNLMSPEEAKAFVATLP